MSQLISKLTGGGPVVGVVKEFVPNVGPDVTPDGLGLIAIGGGANITTDGTIPNTLEIRVSGTTDHAVQVGNATGSLASLGVGTDGQVLVAATGANPAFATLTSSGSTITFTPGANTLNLESVPEAIPATYANSFPTDAGTATPALNALTLAGGANINTVGSGSTATVNLNTALTGITSVTGANGSSLQTGTTAGNTLLLKAYNNTSSTYNTFATLTANLVPTFDLATATTIGSSYIYRAGGTDVAVSDGGTGASTLTAHAPLLGAGTSAINPMAVGSTGQTIMGATGADAAWTSSPSFGGTITAGTGLTVTAGGASITGASTINGGTVGLGTDNANSAITVGGGTTARVINIGNSAAAHTVTLGSVNGAAATTVQSGTGALNVTATNGALTINSGTGALAISNDASATTVTVATGGAVKTATFGSTNGASVTTIASGTGGLSVGTSANAHLTTLGSTNTTSATTVQSGSGALNVTSTGGALTINSGVGALAISNDASATTITIGTGGAVKGITLGSTNTTSSTIVQSGTGNVAINTGLTIDSTGRNYNTKQPCFLAYLGTGDNNVTGNGAVYRLGSGNALTKVFDIGNNLNTNGTFTAPITGKYYFSADVFFVGGTSEAYGDCQFLASSRNLDCWTVGTGTTLYAVKGSCLMDMVAGDTLVVNCIVGGNVGDTCDSQGSSGNTWMSGYLVC